MKVDEVIYVYRFVLFILLFLGKEKKEKEKKEGGGVKRVGPLRVSLCVFSFKNKKQTKKQKRKEK